MRAATLPPKTQKQRMSICLAVRWERSISGVFGARSSFRLLRGAATSAREVFAEGGLQVFRDRGCRQKAEGMVLEQGRQVAIAETDRIDGLSVLVGRILTQEEEDAAWVRLVEVGSVNADKVREASWGRPRETLQVGTVAVNAYAHAICSFSL